MIMQLVCSKENSMNMKQDEQWDMTRHAPMPRPKDDDGI